MCVWKGFFIFSTQISHPHNRLLIYSFKVLSCFSQLMNTEFIEAEVKDLVRFINDCHQKVVVVNPRQVGEVVKRTMITIKVSGKYQSAAVAASTVFSSTQDSCEPASLAHTCPISLRNSELYLNCYFPFCSDSWCRTTFVFFKLNKFYMREIISRLELFVETKKYLKFLFYSS